MEYVGKCSRNKVVAASANFFFISPVTFA